MCFILSRFDLSLVRPPIFCLYDTKRLDQWISFTLASLSDIGCSRICEDRGLQQSPVLAVLVMSEGAAVAPR